MEPFNPEKFLVLVVDDVSKNLQVIGSMLDYSGYSTTFATSGQQALDRVNTAKPDLILLDLMMPEMDGLEVCEKLKADEENREIPVIFLTASHEQKNMLQAFAMGAVDYVTKPFKAPELLARVKTHLELKQTRDELKETLEELVLARDGALDAARIKSQFIATMSHEIRTPMNGVLGMTQLLLKTDLDSQQRDWLETLKYSGESLLIIVEDILNFSRLESGNLHLNSYNFELTSTVENLMKLFTPKAEAKGLKISCVIEADGPVKLHGDEHRLRQILTNLVENGIKFTEKGEVVLEVEMLEDSASRGKHQAPRTTEQLQRWHFSVRDTGIGIAPEAQEKLFQPFSQVDASNTRKYGGTGLGLAICKQLVQLMGGEIGCSSTAGEGSTFWFTVNFSKQKLAKSTPKSKVAVGEFSPDRIEEKAQGNKVKILLVEDTRINQKVVLNQLEILEYQADCVNNGQEALEKLTATHDYDIVLMDCQMPVLDGYEATRLLRQGEGKLRHTVVVGVTANAMEGDREKCLGAGMDDYLSKPVSLEQLSAMLAKWSPSSDVSGMVAMDRLSEPEEIATDDKSIIDLDRLQAISGDDRELELDFLQIFVEDLELYLAEAKIALAETDAIALAQKAHQIKGSALNMGVNFMPTIAAKLQHQAKANNLLLAAELITDLEQTLKRVKAFAASRHQRALP